MLETNMRKILVTAALPYANGKLHIGHVRSTYLPADVYSKYCKLKQYDCIYVCASDEHGAPIQINAEKEGRKAEEITKEFHEIHKEEFKRLGINFDIFYHTHSKENKEFTEMFFEKLKKRIYKKEVEQMYCPKCNRFLPDRYVLGTCPYCGAENQYGDGCEKCGRVYSPTQLIEPKCAICGTTPIRKKSTHYFFKLSEFSEFLLNWFNENKELPQDVVHHLKGWIDEGLQDWDITRDAPYFGIKIPGEKNKYFYVWFDAPIGYVSSTAKWAEENGRSWKEFWEDKNAEIVHFIGKDIEYHHFLFWPSMLKEAGLNLPRRIPTRGWAIMEGRKMSKSRGTLISLEDYLNRFDADFLRYYYIATTPNTISDGEFSWKEFQTKVNNELIDEYGNFIYRVLSFVKNKFKGEIPEPAEYNEEDKKFAESLKNFAGEVEEKFEKIELKKGLEKVMGFTHECNSYFNKREPWHLIKENTNEAKTVVFLSTKAVYALSLALYPVVTNSSEKVFKQLNVEKASKKWGDYSLIKGGMKIGDISPLYEKINNEDIEKISQ